MKNLITMWRKASALLTLVGVLFASCNDISEDDSSGAGGSQKARLSFSCNIDSRTIMPVNMAESDITKIVLKAQKSGESDFTQIGEWLSSNAKNAFSLMESDDSVEVDAGSYTFTLDLYTSKNSEYRLTQSGTLSKTVSAGTNLLSFSTSYVQNGDFSFVFTFAETARVGAIKAGLFTTENYGESPLVDGVNSFDFEELAFSEGEDGTISAVYSKNEVPNGTTSLPYCSFGTCSKLESLIIPKTLTKIESGAFTNCNALKTVYYSGSETDKAKMTISDTVIKGTSVTWTYNYEP